MDWSPNVRISQARTTPIFLLSTEHDTRRSPHLHICGILSLFNVVAGHHTLYLFTLRCFFFFHFPFITMIPPRLVALADLELIFWEKGKEFGMDKIQGGRHRAAFLFLHSLVVAGLDWAGRRNGMGWDGTQDTPQLEQHLCFF